MAKSGIKTERIEINIRDVCKFANELTFYKKSMATILAQIKLSISKEEYSIIMSDAFKDASNELRAKVVAILHECKYMVEVVIDEYAYKKLGFGRKVTPENADFIIYLAETIFLDRITLAFKE